MVSRITELDPTRRRIHVTGEVHPGELAERGYARRGEEWVLELRRPTAGRAARGEPSGDGRDDVDPFVDELPVFPMAVKTLSGVRGYS